MPLVVAFRLLTILPVRGWRDATSREYGAAVGWYPAVGYVLGGVITLLDLSARRVSLPPGVTAWLLIAVLAVLTGFLHLDGVIDTWDAAFAHRSPAERLVIARDPRAGAFGVVGIVVLLGLKAALLASPLGGQRTLVLWCVPALARAVMTAVIVLLPTARGTEGFGASVKQHARPHDLVLALTLALVPALVLLRGEAVVLVLGAVGGGGAMALFAVRRLGGATGDVYGAACEWAEVGALLTAALYA